MAAPRVLLLDADGNLFPSEAPAFDASSVVTNRFLATFGIQANYTPEYLLATTTGKNFRTTAVELALAEGVAVDPALRAGGAALPRAGNGTLTVAALDEWVAEEQRVVTEHLGRVLRPDQAVLEPLRRLAERYLIAAVSSSALARLDACFRATGVDELIPPERRYSAENSLPAPTSKPDPAIYTYAAAQLGVPPGHALAVEDSLPGVQSAVAAGIPTAGNLAFVASGERPARRRSLLAAGATVIVESWEHLAGELLENPAA